MLPATNSARYSVSVYGKTPSASNYRSDEDYRIGKMLSATNSARYSVSVYGKAPSASDYWFD